MIFKPNKLVQIISGLFATLLALYLVTHSEKSYSGPLDEVEPDYSEYGSRPNEAGKFSSEQFDVNDLSPDSKRANFKLNWVGSNEELKNEAIKDSFNNFLSRKCRKLRVPGTRRLKPSDFMKGRTGGGEGNPGPTDHQFFHRGGGEGNPAILDFNRTGAVGGVDRAIGGGEGNPATLDFNRASAINNVGGGEGNPAKLSLIHI